MQSVKQTRGNALLAALCLIVVISAAGFMYMGYSARRAALDAPVMPPRAR